MIALLLVAASAISGGGSSGSPSVNPLEPPVRTVTTASYNGRVSMSALAASDNNLNGGYWSGNSGEAWMYLRSAGTATNQTIIGFYNNSTAPYYRPTAMTRSFRAKGAQLSSTTSSRWWPLLLIRDGSVFDGDSSISVRYCGIRHSTAASDPAWMCCSGNTSTAGCTSTGSAVVTGRWYVFQILSDTSECTCNIYTTGSTPDGTATRTSPFLAAEAYSLTLNLTNITAVVKEVVYTWIGLDF